MFSALGVPPLYLGRTSIHVEEPGFWAILQYRGWESGTIPHFHAESKIMASIMRRGHLGFQQRTCLKTIVCEGVLACPARWAARVARLGRAVLGVLVLVRARCGLVPPQCHYRVARGVVLQCGGYYSTRLGRVLTSWACYHSRGTCGWTSCVSSGLRVMCASPVILWLGLGLGPVCIHSNRSG